LAGKENVREKGSSFNSVTRILWKVPWSMQEKHNE